ncbi:outer membrane protein, cobalt-zinc-cadmium efflux system [Chitinophaga ginsengisegetis]|uniref:Outer membrane protein, cobalt-zinc-cadmium efflux system n=2 Tax=Chitinophaga ginsengisegetis TaxID=393003 RepID=A0A1T5P8W5_9BACT|nr:outer membrane protein, cobalt-zinc-cadmium efflux system [Chitinophaga ginsengisegetis]
MQFLYRFFGQMFLWMAIHSAVLAQADSNFQQTPVPLAGYLRLVATQHLGYAAQQYNVSIAAAGIESAKVFPDPQLSLDGFDNQHRVLKLSYGYNSGISTTLELGGKRKARVALAQSGLELSQAQLQDYFRQLRADATIAWYNALLQQGLLRVQQHAGDIMRQLAAADAIRFQKGVITATDARQSELEANQLLNSIYQQEADFKTALVQLNINTGRSHGDTLLLPAGGFDHLERDFNLAILIADAQESRADILAANATKTVAEKSLALVKANRKIDLGINAGVGYNAAATSDIAPTPRYIASSAGISVPLKWSNHYKGDLHSAQYAIKQAGVAYNQVQLQIQVEVTQAWYNYHAAQQQVQQFEHTLLTSAQQVLQGKMYSYQRGETSLLEVLNAQRTWNEVQQNYQEALFRYAAALVELERAAGIWDIS